MHILNYHTLKTLRTDPKKYVQHSEDVYTDSDLVAMLALNEELFQDLVGFNQKGPEDEKIKKSLGHYIDYIRSCLSDQGQITGDQLVTAAKYVESGLNITPEATEQIIAANIEYINSCLTDKALYIDKEKLEELKKYKQMISSYFVSNCKESKDKVSTGKLYKSNDGLIRVIALGMDTVNYSVNFEGSRKSVAIEGNIHYLLINEKFKQIIIRQLLIVDDVTKFTELMKENKVDFQTGLNLLVLEQTMKLKEYKINYNIIGVDKNNVCIFSYTKFSLDRVKKDIKKEIENAGYNIFLGDFSIPGEFKKEYFI